MQLAYLFALLLFIGAMGAIDAKYKLVFFRDRPAAIRSVFAGLVFFIIWDLMGIHAGIFFEGKSEYMTGFMVLPHLPIEEFFFLTLLVYTPLVVYEFARGRHV